MITASVIVTLVAGTLGSVYYTIALVNLALTHKK